jgi:hypothetical protein
MSQPQHRWPNWIFGPAPTLKELNVICWGLFVAFLVLPLYTALAGRQSLGQRIEALDADFVFRYSMGRILNEYSAEKLYDQDLMKKVCSQVHPLKAGTYGPSPYPPFIGILFRPFALMPYSVAYLVWVSISVALYLLGLTIVSSRFFLHEPLRRSLIFFFALSFYYPFIIETAINGQVCAIGFFALALAMREEDLGHRLLSGVALSLCLYKPTLLMLILPMLVVSRRFKILLGFTIGATALVLFTTAMEGLRVWSGYFNLLLYVGRVSSGIQTRSFVRLWKFVDLMSFSALIPGGRSWPGLLVLFVGACWAVFSLLRIWWKSAGAGEPVTSLVWATTITWTLLLNVYVPIYDSILIVLSIVITAGVLKDLRGKPLYRWFTALWLLIYASACVAEDVAFATGFQIMTVLIAGLGILQLTALRRVPLG